MILSTACYVHITDVTPTAYAPSCSLLFVIAQDEDYRHQSTSPRERSAPALQGQGTGVEIA